MHGSGGSPNISFVLPPSSILLSLAHNAPAHPTQALSCPPQYKTQLQCINVFLPLPQPLRLFLQLLTTSDMPSPSPSQHHLFSQHDQTISISFSVFSHNTHTITPKPLSRLCTRLEYCSSTRLQSLHTFVSPSSSLFSVVSACTLYFHRSNFICGVCVRCVC